MGFTGIAVDMFLTDYSKNLTRLFIQSGLEHIGEVADSEDVNKLQDIADSIAEGETDDLTELGSTLGKMLNEYPQANKKVEKEISNFNEGILADFMARSQLKYVVELGKYVNETIDKNKRVGEIIERMKKEPK